MATANLGRVGFVNKGTYSGATAYKVNDVVTYNTGTYACIQANTGQAPTNTSYWQNWIADNAVHKTGDETIAGVKNFSDFATFGYGLSDAIYLVNYGSSTTGIQFGSSSVGSGAGTIQYKRSDGTIRFMSGDASAQADKMVIDASGNVLVTGSGSLGYGTGSGGTVTQLTSKGTAVTLNKPCGQITTHNASLAAGASVDFNFRNSFISVYDNLIITGVWGVAPVYEITVKGVGGYNSIISIKNITAISLSEAITLNFIVIKGSQY